jgi:hypothetical protein
MTFMPVGRMRLAAAILPVALLAAGCDIRVDEGGISSVGIMEGRAEDVWTRSYTLPAGSTLEISGRNGQIEVQGSTGTRIEVRAEREVRADSDETARQWLQKLEIREETTPSSVKIRTAGEESSWAPPGLGRRIQGKVEYSVRVPAGLVMAFRTENGGVRLQNVNGRITAATTNGGITGSDVAGSLHAETVNGGIRIDLASIAGDVEMKTTNGGIRLTIPPDARVTLAASVVNGGIDLDSEFGVQEPEGRNQKFTAPINGGGPTLSATSVNGGVRIRARGSVGD